MRTAVRYRASSRHVRSPQPQPPCFVRDGWSRRAGTRACRRQGRLIHRSRDADLVMIGEMLDRRLAVDDGAGTADFYGWYARAGHRASRPGGFPVGPSVRVRRYLAQTLVSMQTDSSASHPGSLGAVRRSSVGPIGAACCCPCVYRRRTPRTPGAAGVPPSDSRPHPPAHRTLLFATSPLPHACRAVCGEVGFTWNGGRVLPGGRVHKQALRSSWSGNRSW